MCGEMAELVEGARLEIVYGRNVIKGSNPFLSATPEQAMYRLLRLFLQKLERTRSAVPPSRKRFNLHQLNVQNGFIAGKRRASWRAPVVRLF